MKIVNATLKMTIKGYILFSKQTIVAPRLMEIPFTKNNFLTVQKSFD